MPVPTIMATGVASPSAQGHEITSTAIAMESANSNDCPSSSHTTAASRAIPMTTGTNTPLILSASFAIGALEELASSTSSIICARVVSPPTFWASILKNPVLFSVAAMTESPTVFSTGMLSPVSADWSTAEEPSTITPSTGMLFPGRISTMSPTLTCSTGISTSFPSRSTSAVFGAKSISFEIASEVLPFERASRYLPRVISVKIVPADSKYKSIR